MQNSEIMFLLTYNTKSIFKLLSATLYNVAFSNSTTEYNPGLQIFFHTNLYELFNLFNFPLF